MNKLYPIAKESTRHLFVDPALSKPTAIHAEGYEQGELTGFIKPGRVPNLAQLCKPENTTFSVTEEPDMETLGITEILFGMFDNNDVWTVCHVEGLDIKLKKDGPATASLKNTSIQISADLITDGIFIGDKVDLKPDSIVAIDLDILYSRGTRCLEYSNKGGYDQRTPQILGLKFNLDYKDSKSTESLFKTAPAEIKQTFHREIAA